MNEFLFKIKKKLFHTFSLCKQAKRISRDINDVNIDFRASISVLNNFPSFRINQKPTEIVYLLKLIEKHNVKVICEIGAYKGGTLSLFCKAAPKNAIIVSIDINYPIDRKIANKSLSRRGQKVACINGDSKDNRTIKKVVRALKGNKIDLLFVDGDHSFLGVANDLINYSPYVKEGGIIAFHDIQPVHRFDLQNTIDAYVGDVPEFWAAIKMEYKQTKEIIENPKQDGYGIGIIFKI